MHPVSPRLVRLGLAAGLLLCTSGVAMQGQTVTRFDLRTTFQTLAPQATNVIDFQSGFAPGGGDFPSGTGSDSLNTFTQAGFVMFKTGPSYTQEVIDGRNVGQGDNDVYTVLSANKAAITADVTFGAGVLALGFDFKNTANGPGGGAGTIAQSFTFTLFSGVTNLGSFASATVPNGSSFQFLGFTSDTPITELTVVATVPGASPNLDIVLDNFAVANPVPEPGVTVCVVLGLVGLVAGHGFVGRRRQTGDRAG